MLEGGVAVVGVDQALEPPRRGPFQRVVVAERGTQPQHAAGVVAVELVHGAVGHRRAGGHAAHVGFGAGDRAQGVAGGDHVAVAVVVEADGDPVGVGQRTDQAALGGVHRDVPALGTRQAGGERAVTPVDELDTGAAGDLMGGDPTVVVVVPPFDGAAGPGPAGRQPVRGEVLAAGGPVEPGGLHTAALRVETAPHLMALVIDKTGQPPGLVVFEDADRPALGVGHHRAVTRVVGEGGLPPERRHLGDHPALTVIGVAAQAHPVRVPHLHHPARVVGHVAAGAQPRSGRPDPPPGRSGNGPPAHTTNATPPPGRRPSPTPDAGPPHGTPTRATRPCSRTSPSPTPDRHRAHQAVPVEGPHRPRPHRPPIPPQLPAASTRGGPGPARPAR